MSRSHDATAPGTLAHIGLAPPTPGSGSTWSPSRTRWSIAAIALLAGLAAALAGPVATDSPTVDAVLVAVAVGSVTWLGAAALRWDAAVITLLAGLATFTLLGAAIGIVAAVVGFAIPVRPGLRGVVSAVLIGIALNLAARSELDVFLGASAIIAVVLAGYVATIGFCRRPERSRRIVAGLALAVGSVAVVSVLAVAGLGASAAGDVRTGQRLTEQGLDALGDGELATARAAFTAAADAFAAADQRVDTPLTFGARYVPVLAQHHRVLTDLNEQAADAARAIADELGRIDLDGLSTTGGSIDVARVRALEAPLRTIHERIAELDTAVADFGSRWLLPPVARRVDRLAVEVADQRDRSGDALAAAAIAPGLLGGDEPRTYFIGFTTPSEARGGGAFMGNWAEVTVTDGNIEMTAFGRADDLNEAGDPATRRFPTTDRNTGATDDSDDADDSGGSNDAGDDRLGSSADDADDFARWISRYGPFNLASGPDGTTGRQPWKNINMSPDMTMTGRAIAALYPQSGGGELDGVFVIDVYALARLLEFTGPVALPDGGALDGTTSLTADDAAEFLLNDQYRLTATDARIDVLEHFSRSVVDALLAQPLPAPNELVDALGPMVDQGRIAAWMARPDEQAALAHLGLAGTLPDPSDGDGVAIVFNNAAGNKIDYYLAADATYRVAADARTGSATATLTLTMRNGAPVNGQPNYVIGNPIGLPTGTNRTWVSVFTRLPVSTVTRDGDEIFAEPGNEAGYFVTSMMVTLDAGESATLVLEMSGTIDVRDQYDLVTRTPPTVAPTPLQIDATWIDDDGGRHTRREAITVAGAGRSIVDMSD